MNRSQASSATQGVRRASSHESSPTILAKTDVISRGGSQELKLRMSKKYKPRPVLNHGTQQQTYITSLVEDMKWAFQELGYNISYKTLESWAVFVHEMLTRESHYFHGVAHVFHISAGASPIQLIASVFRDAILYYIDGETNQKSKGKLEGVLLENTFILNSLSDPRELLIAKIFGFDVGEDLSAYEGRRRGLDLFLSCIVAHRLMRNNISAKHTAQMAACLEATIPFRKAKTPGGPTPLDILHCRLIKCNSEFNLGISDEEMVETVQLAVDLRNRTVGNMLTDDLAEFLDNSWRLLPEHNEALRKSNLYTLGDYYSAVFSMSHMVQEVEPESVFATFKGIPTPEETSAFCQVKLAQKLHIALLYIRCRLASAAVVISFAVLTGGDAPKCLFFGDLPQTNRHSVRLGENFHLPPPQGSDEAFNREVYDLLRGQRMSESGFDTRNEPMAAYLYRELKDSGLVKIVDTCAVPMTTEKAFFILRSLPLKIVTVIGREVGRVAVSRRKGIERVLLQLGEG